MSIVPHQPDRPDQPSATRRTLLIGIAALVAQAGFWNNPFGGGTAQAQPAPGAPDTGTAAANSATGSNAFLAFSQAITGHADVRPETAARIEAAMQKSIPGFAATLQQLGALQPAVPNDPKALLAAVTDAGLRDIALAVVAAWYTGTVGKGAQAVVVSYAEALMFRPVSDGQVVPTYCTYGPQWWTRSPPPIRVSAPVARPAPSPPTVGTPESKGAKPL